MDYGSLGFPGAGGAGQDPLHDLGLPDAARLDPDLARAPAVGDDAGSPRPQPRQHRADQGLGHHPLHRRRAEVHGQGGLRPLARRTSSCSCGRRSWRWRRRSSSPRSSRSVPPLCWGELLAKNPSCGQPIGLQIAQLDIGLLFYFAISSLSVYGATLAGWASHNKWSMMGGLRASSQMMSYEVTMGMAVLGLVPGVRHARARR